MIPSVSLAQTTREYRLSTGWRIFVYLFASILFAVGGFLAMLPFIDDTITPGAEYIFIPMGLGLSLLMLYTLLEAHYGKIRLSRGRIEQISVLGNKTLLLSEIKGFEVDPYYIRVYPLDQSKPTIKISVVGIESQEIIQWLQLRKHNLADVTYLEEEEALLANHALGLTEQERLAKLSEARSVANWLNGIGFAIMGWLFFYPYPYNAAIWIGIIYPFSLLAASYYYKGIFRLNEKNKSAHPSIMGGLLMAAMAVGYRSFCDVEMVIYSPIWPWAATTTLVFFFLLLFSTNEFTFTKAQDFGIAFLMLLLLCPYGYGVPVLANKMLDTSAPVVHQARVLDKHSTSGSSASYYLTLEPWGPRTAPEDVTVTHTFYETAPVGATISVYLYQGALNTPWLQVE